MRVNPRDFIHENDRKALEGLKSIPGFDQLLKGFMKVWNEPSMRIINMSSKVRLSPEQCPRIYNLLVPVCEKFEMEVPELYLELNRTPNAYTSGDTYIFITITTGLLELMTDEEIQAVLAHECGHIICHHVLYHTMGKIILNGTAAALGLGGLVNTALSAAFSYWIRCSEFSADRASAVFCGGSDRTVECMMRLAGGGKDIADEINAELFMQQAEQYKGYVGDSKWNKVLEFLALMNCSHPFLAVRAAEIRDWCNTDTFNKITAWVNSGEQSFAANDLHCPKCGAAAGADWAFCKKCGSSLSGISPK